MVKIKFLDQTCTRRTWGIYRFGPDGLSVKSFPGEPADYDPFARKTRTEQRRLDLGLLLLMRSAERRRRFELVHVDDAEAKPEATTPAVPPRKQAEGKEDPRARAKEQALDEKARSDAAAREKAATARYDAEHPEEREEREPAKRSAPPDPIISEAGIPLSVPKPPAAVSPARNGQTVPPAPSAKPATPPKGKAKS
jgi:hypothetical protein